MLRRALFLARLSEEDVAAQLDVDPKTVRRWLEGRLPYPRHRLAMSRLVEVDESDLWPGVHAARVAQAQPEEIKAVYPHRWAVPHAVWRELFESAQLEIDILAYSALFLVDDVDLLGVFADKARAGVRVRIALAAPDSAHIAERGAQGGISDSIDAKIRNALTLYKTLLDVGNVELRLHQTTLHSSLYLADNDLLVNQHAYGILAANSIVFHLRRGDANDMFTRYVESFVKVWSASKQYG
jgi:hypothetical protein